MIKPTNYTAKQIIGIYDGLKSSKSTMENHHQEINDYVCPSFSDVTQLSETPGRKKGLRLYTGIGQYCINKLSKAMHSALTSTAAQWFNMRLSNDEIMKQKEIADWFGKSSRVMFDYMVASNFPNEIMKTYKALIGYGTAAITCDSVNDPRTQKFSKLKYETWSSREWVFAEGGDELPTMAMRLHRLTPAKAMELFSTHPRFKGLGKTGDDAFGNPEKRYKERHEYLEVFFKRDIYLEEKANKMDWRHMPWGYTVIAYKDKAKVIEGGMMEQNPAVGRWEKNADDMGWGRSPSMDALPTIKTMNEIRAGGLKALDKDNDPPLVITHRGVIGNVRTHAGGIIYKRKGAEIDQLASGARYDASQMYMQELAEEVKQHYMIDMIEMQPNESGTLGEFQVRHEQMMRLLGPTYGRLTYDIFNPLLKRTFNILLRKGKFPPMPGILVDLATNPKFQDYINLDVEYTGPLARSQRLSDISAIHLAYQDAGMIAQTTGTMDAFDHLDGDAAMKLSLELRGVPSEVHRSQQDIDDTREARQQRMAAQAEQADRMDEAEATDMEAEAANKIVQLRSGGNKQ